MNWTPLSDATEVAKIKEDSFKVPQVIFKHSTRCSISSMVKGRLERSGLPEGIPFHCLDLIQFRNISQDVAKTFDVEHESPQVLVIKDGACVYDESHNAINMDEILEQAKM